jgi:hypothetical protein
MTDSRRGGRVRRADGIQPRHLPSICWRCQAVITGVPHVINLKGEPGGTDVCATPCVPTLYGPKGPGVVIPMPKEETP